MNFLRWTSPDRITRPSPNVGRISSSPEWLHIRATWRGVIWGHMYHLLSSTMLAANPRPQTRKSASKLKNPIDFDRTNIANWPWPPSPNDGHIFVPRGWSSAKYGWDTSTSPMLQSMPLIADLGDWILTQSLEIVNRQRCNQQRPVTAAVTMAAIVNSSDRRWQHQQSTAIKNNC